MSEVTLRFGRSFWMAASVRSSLAAFVIGAAFLPGASAAQAPNAAPVAEGRRVVAPQPPSRPFDLAPVDPTVTVPVASPTQPGAAAPTPPPDAPDPAAPADASPRPVVDAPLPPQRPTEAPRSNPADEDEEPTWPRRTPQQRDLEFDPRELPGEVAANGISTDPGTSIRCLPPDLRRVLDAVAKQYGAVRVTSTQRPAWRARRNSLHRSCRAMDFRVPGQRPRAVLDFVKTLPETGGHKVYWNGLVHVDNGPWRTW